MTTTKLIQGLVLTLNLGLFIAGMSDWDVVTRRQCLARGLREISTAASVQLHGATAVKGAIKVLSDQLENLTDGPPV
jgi:hypothetical protein